MITSPKLIGDSDPPIQEVAAFWQKQLSDLCGGCSRESGRSVFGGKLFALSFDFYYEFGATGSLRLFAVADELKPDNTLLSLALEYDRTII